MPIRKYTCPDCHREQRRFETGEDEEDIRCHPCGSIMVRVLGVPQPRAMTMADEYHGKSIEQDVSQKLLDRARDHEKKVEKYGS
jgi:DNA-directed RNA polymerase subunit RPC12/RpoP